MKTFIALLLLSSVAQARPHTLIDCKPLDGEGFSAKFLFDYFDDKYSHVTVHKNKTKLFKLSGDTKLNPCLESDMSAGSDTAESYRDIIAVIGVHDLGNCQGPFHFAQVGATGANTSNVLSGNLTVGYFGRFSEERVKCVVTESKQ